MADGNNLLVKLHCWVNRRDENFTTGGEGDYGPAAEREIAAKRADYFIAGTLVVWDVDPVAETVAWYRSTAPDAPIVFRRGDTADAEPAAPGWRIAVDEVFA